MEDALQRTHRRTERKESGERVNSPKENKQGGVRSTRCRTEKE